MIPHTYDAVAGADFLAARVGGRSDPITVGRFKALEGDPQAHRRGCPYGGGGGLTHARLRGSCAGFYRVNRKAPGGERKGPRCDARFCALLCATVATVLGPMTRWGWWRLP